MARDRQAGNGPRPGGDPAGGRREDGGELRELPVELIKPNPSQPRTQFDPEALDAPRLLDRDQRRRPAAAGPPARTTAATS